MNYDVILHSKRVKFAEFSESSAGFSSSQKLLSSTKKSKFEKISRKLKRYQYPYDIQLRVEIYGAEFYACTSSNFKGVKAHKQTELHFIVYIHT